MGKSKTRSIKQPTRPSSRGSKIIDSPVPPGFLKRNRPWILVGILVSLTILFFAWGGLARIVHSSANLALQSGKLDVAENWLATLDRIPLANGETAFLQARLARKRGDLDAMAAHLKEAFDRKFDPKRLNREQTLAMASLGRLDSSIESTLKKWLKERDADLSEVLDAYTTGLTVLSRFPETIELLEVWEEECPWEPMVHQKLGRIHEHLFQNEPAEEEYRNAVAKDPSFVQGWFSLGRLLLHVRKPAEALEAFAKCDRGTSKLAAQTNIALCEKALGNIEKAKEILLAVMEHSEDEIRQSYRSVDEIPERFVAASELGGIETELGEYSAAREHLEMALRYFPLDSIGRYSYAVALRGLGEREKAEENFEKVKTSRAALDQVTQLQERIGMNPKDTDARIQIGKIILENESEKTGVYWIKSVFSYDARNESAHAALADYYQSKMASDPAYKQLYEYHLQFVKSASTTSK
ncbi:tetratricopeptide repeat protein [Pirellulaceae bacterium SH501]